MKNILAENLLRFGVKNLTEADKQKLMEQNPAGSTMSPEAQLIQDKMIADTQALAKGAVGVTFGDMKVVSASIAGVEPEHWKLNGVVQLILTTNYGGDAKSIKIGIMADETGNIKIVTLGGVLKPLDATGIRASLDGSLGKAYKSLLDNAVTQQPSPYKTLMTVLKGVADKYKETGLWAATK